MKTQIARFLIEDHAATAVEYAVMLSLIIATCMTAIGLFGKQVMTVWTSNSDKLDAAAP